MPKRMIEKVQVSMMKYRLQNYDTGFGLIKSLKLRKSILINQSKQNQELTMLTSVE